MRYYFAPLEGITGYIFRNAHRKYFPGVDKYFAPFISTNQNYRFTNRELRDVLPENNRDTNVVPQLLGKVAEEFVAAAKLLGEMGYGEVNLNFGCPSGTVVAKGKGAGALADPERLDRYLEGIFSGSDINISIKTRLGIASPDEFGAILEIFNRYPVFELIIHPRVQKDFYKNHVNLEAFGRAAETSRSPLCFNGDLKTQEDCEAIGKRFAGVEALMPGRGLVANPALVTVIKGGSPADRDTLRRFHDEIYEGYRSAMQNDRNAIMRMKELWSYFITMFENSESYAKMLRKISGAGQYSALVTAIFDELDISPPGNRPEDKAV